ncbi:MAG: response regulator [Marivita sp.]|uniref:response regulator n=1 Tax=Marivita sp. TaxID=2003365 RepID=UPI003EF82FBF
MVPLPEGQSYDNAHWTGLCSPSDAFGVMRKSKENLLISGHWHDTVSIKDARGQAHKVDLSVSTLDTGDWLCVLTSDVDSVVAHPSKPLDYREVVSASANSATENVVQKLMHDFANSIALVSGISELLFDTDARTGRITDIERERMQLAIDHALAILDSRELFVRARETASYHDVGTLLRSAAQFVETQNLSDCEICVSAVEHPTYIWATREDFLQVILDVLTRVCDLASNAKIDVSVIDTSGLDASEYLGAFDPSLSACGVEIRFTARIDPPELQRLLLEGSNEEPDHSDVHPQNREVIKMLLIDNRARLWLGDMQGDKHRVILSWPDRPVEEWTGPSPVLNDRKIDITGHKILVLDDSPLMSDYLAQILSDQGAIAVAVCNPDEALELVGEAPRSWSAIVTDLHMPTMTGLELARRCAVLAGDVPVVLVTAKPEDAMTQGRVFAAVFAKPVDPKALIASVSDVIQKRT